MFLSLIIEYLKSPYIDIPAHKTSIEKDAKLKDENIPEDDIQWIFEWLSDIENWNVYTTEEMYKLVFKNKWKNCYA